MGVLEDWVGYELEEGACACAGAGTVANCIPCSSLPLQGSSTTNDVKVQMNRLLPLGGRLRSICGSGVFKPYLRSPTIPLDLRLPLMLV